MTTLPGHVGQPEVAALEAVGQPLVVDAEQVQHRGVQVVDVDDVLDGVVAELVGRAVGDAALDAAAGQPDREALDVVVAAVALGHRRAAELAAPDDQRVVEHAALLQVLDQRRRAAWSTSLAVPAMSLLDVAVVVPVAVVELDEPHAALGQPAGQQAVGRERAVGPLGAVQVEHVLAARSQMSISSGTLVCMRNAISYWLIRVAISGSSTDVVLDAG